MNALYFPRVNLVNALKPATHSATLVMAVLLLAACGGGGSAGVASGLGGSNEKAPLVEVRVIGSPIGGASGGIVDVAVTATKQDNSDTTTVTFPPIVESSSCTATLDGDTNSRYSIDAGISTAVATYNVRPTIIGAVNDCGVFSFNATEGSATGNTEFSDSISFFVDTDTDGIADDKDTCPLIANSGQSDLDNDGEGDVCDDSDNDIILDSMDNCPLIANPGQSDLDNDGEGDACDTDDDGDNIADAADVDADGDGLIELSTAAELNMMRYNLGGTGLDDGTSDTDNTIGGNSMGCGGLLGITTCNGYEQMADIDLNDLPKDSTGSNWEPVGTCGSGPKCRAALEGAQLFSGMFVGNDFTINNMFINVTTDRYGVGFFGAISSNAQVHNLHIRGGSITRTGGTSQYVGGLVGRVNGATISNSSVTLDELSGTESVGGLVGRGRSATISSSVATVGSVSGTGRDVGGLVGDGSSVTISSSVATVGSISGTSGVGGLVGYGIQATISSSVATVDSVSGTSIVGGLVGDGSSAKISSSVATVGAISGSSDVGGLVGLGFLETIISSSVATVGSISGTNNDVGGLVGDGFDATIRSSVATVGSISGSSEVGGLVGFGTLTTISSSVAITNNINGTSNLGGLVGGDTPASVTSSYWDNKVVGSNGQQLADNGVGSGHTTAALQNPGDTNSDGSFPEGIYAEWDNAYCDPNTGAYSATAPNPLGDYIRVWDLETSTEYPAINCVQNFFSLADQREAARRALSGELPLVD